MKSKWQLVVTVANAALGLLSIQNNYGKRGKSHHKMGNRNISWLQL